jgi:AcrR family transcriptional regulator
MSQDTPRRGRPRSTEARTRALKAAREILLREGFGRLTVEAVAARAGIGKPTIYRTWANAQELALAALVDTPLPTPEATGATARAALTAQLQDLIAAFATTRGRQMTMALASADPTSELTKAFRTRVILASREAGRALLARGIASGEIAAPDDIEALLDMIYAPLFYRLLAGHQPLAPALAPAIVSLAFAALAP